MPRCSSLLSVGCVTAFGCTVVSMVTRRKCFSSTAPPRCAASRLSASNASIRSAPIRLRQRVSDEAWFDPIEWGIRDRVRGFIEGLVEQELDAALGRGRYERGAEAPKGYRHGTRERQLIGSFDPVRISVPRARLAATEGVAEEWRSSALPRYARMTRQVEALIAGTYLSGTNTRPGERALGVWSKGVVGKDVISRTWRKIRTDWDAWSKRGRPARTWSGSFWTAPRGWSGRLPRCGPTCPPALHGTQASQPPRACAGRAARGDLGRLHGHHLRREREGSGEVEAPRFGGHPPTFAKAIITLTAHATNHTPSGGTWGGIADGPPLASQHQAAEEDSHGFRGLWRTIDAA